MKRLLLIGLTALLAACTPTVSTVAHTAVDLAGPAIELGQRDPATFARDGLDVLLSNRGTDDITGDPSRPGDGAVIVVVGTPDLSVSGNAGNGAQACHPGSLPGYWDCYRTLIPPGFAFRVIALTGRIESASAYYYRPGRKALLIVKALK